MNTTTAQQSGPSDAAIAQAFREIYPAADHADTQMLFNRVLERASELNRETSIRGLLDTLGGQLDRLHPQGRSARQLQAAGGEGGFVVVPAEATHAMEYALSQALDSGDYSIGECLNLANAAALKSTTLPKSGIALGTEIEGIPWTEEMERTFNKTMPKVRELVGLDPPAGGFVVLPRVATDEMLLALFGADFVSYQDAYAKMIAAAPAAQVSPLSGGVEDAFSALRQVRTVMGPKVPSCCQGCEWEWSEALRIIDAALQSVWPGQKGEQIAADFYGIPGEEVGSSELEQVVTEWIELDDLKAGDTFTVEGWATVETMTIRVIDDDFGWERVEEATQPPAGTVGGGE